MPASLTKPLTPSLARAEIFLLVNEFLCPKVYFEQQQQQRRPVRSAPAPFHHLTYQHAAFPPSAVRKTKENAGEMVIDREGGRHESQIRVTQGAMGGFVTDVRPREVPSQSEKGYVPFMRALATGKAGFHVYSVGLDNNWPAGAGEWRAVA
jgi:hypothetical protein